MASYRHRRQILLFLVAILLPCSVLVALSLRMIRQERELAEKRSADEQRRLVNEIRHELLARLERIKLQEVSALAAQRGRAGKSTYENSAVVLVGRVERNRLILPWEMNPAADEARKHLGEAEFARRIQQAEHAELVARQFVQAARLYREALGVARRPLQDAYARLLLARALARSGEQTEAVAHYRRILALPSEVTDEQGVPLCLYAAARLLQAGASPQAVLERIRSEEEGLRGLPPAAAYMLREITSKSVESAPQPALRDAAKDLQRVFDAHIRFLEQALALQDDFPRLPLSPIGATEARNPEPLWISYGDETWLVSVAPPLGAMPAAAVAVRAKPIFAALDSARASSNSPPGQVRFLTDTESKGEALGPNFPGLKVAFVPESHGVLSRKWNLQRSFYFVTLLLVLSVTLFGSYLLWRDVRRELRLAEVRSQFVSSVSHELKTPLTAIRMFAETLRMGRTTDRQVQDEYLETIVNESERLTRLLNNVLDFSKIEQGQKIYHFKPTHLAEVVRTAARALKYPLAQQGFQLRVDIEDGLPAVRADSDALEQAILNLLINAMKYSGESREVDLRLRRQDGAAMIQVTDHGMGIAPEEQARIFEKFYRAPTPENRLVPGTGLGLTLVEHIAEAHGGQVEVRSSPGEGSTFSILLPIETDV